MPHETVTLRTCDLIGAALDWAVAKAVDYKPCLIDDEPGPSYWACQWRGGGMIEVGKNGFSPSTDWDQIGPLIFSHEITIYPPRHLTKKAEGWGAQFYVVNDPKILRGETPLIAAYRAIVSAHLGDSVDVPAELVGGGV